MKTASLWKPMIAAFVAVAFLATPVLLQAQTDKKTLRTWKAKCASCHGEDGKANTEQGKKMLVGDMTTAAYWKDLTDDKVKEAVLNGLKREKNGKKQEMDGYKAKLKPEEVTALIAHAKTFKK